MKKIFITGGAGYVGAVLVPHLLEKDYFVTVLDLMIYGEDVLPSHPNLNAVKGDIRDQNLLNELIPGHMFLYIFIAFFQSRDSKRAIVLEKFMDH